MLAGAWLVLWGSKKAEGWDRENGSRQRRRRKDTAKSDQPHIAGSDFLTVCGQWRKYRAPKLRIRGNEMYLPYGVLRGTIPKRIS